MVQWLRTDLAVRGRGFDPWSGTKTPHAVGQLSPRAATQDPTRCSRNPKQPVKSNIPVQSFFLIPVQSLKYLITLHTLPTI